MSSSSLTGDGAATLGEGVAFLAFAHGQLVAANEGFSFRRADQIGQGFVVPAATPAELEQEASQLTRDLNTLANQNTLDFGAIQDIEAALKTEVPPALGDLEQVYRDAGVNLPPGLVKQRYEDVRAFHESVIRNRQSYLQERTSCRPNYV